MREVRKALLVQGVGMAVCAYVWGWRAVLLVFIVSNYTWGAARAHQGSTK